MRCREIIERLPAFQDGELPSAEVSVVRAHLAYCRTCREEEQRLLTSWERLDSLPTLIPSVDFRARFWERIRNEEQMSPWWVRILAPKLISTACGLALWLFGVSSGVLLFDSKSSQSSRLSTKVVSLFGEANPAGSFSQLILEERHAR